MICSHAFDPGAQWENGSMPVKLPCSHCGEPVSISDKKLAKLYNAMLAKQKRARTPEPISGSPPRVKATPCPWCKVAFSVTDLRLHKPQCPSRPTREKLRPCPHCGVQLGARAMRLHLPRCPSRAAGT